MECEVRFYFPIKQYDDWNTKLQKIDDLTCGGRNYEKTAQFNHPMKQYDFYSKEIDGRFRVRVTRGTTESKCKLSWKRRLPITTSTQINQEEEVELSIAEKEYENLMFLIKNVLHLDEVESYERYRTAYSNNDVEIVLDEYPFGLALEIEAKNEDLAFDIIDRYMNLLGLSYNKAYRLSWDDKYLELCKEQNVGCYKYVTFDKPMPEIK